ncbi:MAG: hypothetical protein DHS80DRAFT_15571, partial [Piptocephalis tieghemiana]
IPQPKGFSQNVPLGLKANAKADKSGGRNTTEHDQAEETLRALRVKKAWDAAMGPAKSIPMNAFMLWMSGNSVQIFSIMITGMLLINPIKAVASTQSVFERFASPNASSSPELLQPKAAYILVQIISLLMGMYKLQAMGLLPTSASDWLAFETPKSPLEYSL